MIEKPYWSNIQDNNNIIGKFGMITFICPHCLNIYTARTKVDSVLYVDPFKEGFSLEQPEVNFVCPHCHEKAIRIDNHIADIAKILLEKKYPIDLDRSCEGHIYVMNTRPSYVFPQIVIKGCVKQFISVDYYDKITIREEFNETYISAGGIRNPNLFEHDKFEFLKIMKEIANELPTLPVVCGFECR